MNSALSALTWPFGLLLLVLLALLRDVNNGYLPKVWLVAYVALLPLSVALAIIAVPCSLVYWLVCWINERDRYDEP